MTNPLAPIQERQIPKARRVRKKQLLFTPKNDQPDQATASIERDWGRLLHRNAADDLRHVTAGHEIPALYYADQPYIVGTADGAWLCVLTTGSGHEGARGQHIISLRSTDRGQHWSTPVCLEPADGPEASWAVPLLLPSGRIVVFYVYNADDLRELPMEPSGVTNRMDSHGYYVFRWSDDHGRTWSKERVTIPVREFAMDRENTTQGKVRLFWNVGRPQISEGSVYLTLHKVGGFGAGWFTRSEGALLRSDDLLQLDDPAKASWRTLPDGEIGLRTPPGGGPIAEEQSLISLSDGSLFVVYRSIDGHPVGCYSRDKGQTWDQPRYLEYANGKRVKHSRAACFAWKLHQGSYVLWFHNHGGKVLGSHPMRHDRAYEDRNPVWMARGQEIQSPRGLELAWGNPEVILYDDDPLIRMSYPDLREEGETIYVTETQKAIARVHQLDARLTRALRLGFEGFSAPSLRREAVLDWSPEIACPLLPGLPPFLTRSLECPYGAADQRAGFSLELEIEGDLSSQTSALFEAWHPTYGGLRLEELATGALRLIVSDGRSEFSWHCDPGVLKGARHHIVIVIDGGSKIISFIVDGVFCDGGDYRQFGWGRFSPHFRGLPAGLPLAMTPVGLKKMKSLRLYPRAFLAAEAEALFLAGKDKEGASLGSEYI